MDFQVQFMYDIDESDIQILLLIPLFFPGMAWPIFMISRLQLASFQMLAQLTAS